MTTTIDYSKLKLFNTAAHFPSKPDEAEDRHNVLMKEFKSMFLHPPKLQPGIPDKPTKAFEISHADVSRPKSRYSAYREKPKAKVNLDPPSPYDDRQSHDVRHHITRRKKKAFEEIAVTDDLVLNKEQNVSAIRSIVKKLPFERTRREQKRTYELLRELWPDELSFMLEDGNENHSVLRQLASVATMDRYPETGLTVFGNTGLHMVLKGSVKPQTLPCLRSSLSTDNDDELFPCPTPLVRRKAVSKLTFGDWFGTLKKVEGREINSKVLTLITLEPCQFLKISIADYKRILLLIQQRIQSEKVSAVQAIPPYDKWPGLSVGKLAALIEWKTYPVGSVMFAEGDIASCIMFVRRGECSVFKQVEAIKTLPNGRKKRLVKNVLMGQLGAGDSLGEHSILEQKPFVCTVVAATDLDVGVILPHKLEELDVTMRTLLSQSAQPKFADMSEDDIHTKFIDQEMKDDWDQLKHKVLLQTINYCGIRPGYGKWSNPLISP